MFPDGATFDPSTPERLLPTPDGGNFNDGQSPEAWADRKGRERAKGYNGNGGATPLAMAVPLIAAGIDPADERSTSSPEGSPASPSPRPAADSPVRIPAGSGPSSPVLLATYDPERSSSRTSGRSYRLVTWTRPQASLFGDLPSERYSATWPTSGMTRRGRAYALPMSALPTVDDGSSSLLETPTANEQNPGDGGELRAQITLGPGGRNGTGIDSRGRPNRGRTLPTPTARDGKGASLPSRSGGAALPDLLPTPQASDAERKGADYARRTRPGSGGDDFTTTIRERSTGGRTRSPSEGGSA